MKGRYLWLTNNSQIEGNINLKCSIAVDIFFVVRYLIEALLAVLVGTVSGRETFFRLRTRVCDRQARHTKFPNHNRSSAHERAVQKEFDPFQACKNYPTLTPINLCIKCRFIPERLRADRSVVTRCLVPGTGDAK